MKKRIIAAMLCLMCTLAFFTGCGNTNQTNQTTETATNGYTFTDSLGNEVTVENPQSVVACMGGLAEIWILAGGEETLTGIASDADFEVTDTVTEIGKNNEPSIETIISINPDFVILSSATAEHITLADTLKQTGINYAFFDVNSFEDYLHTLEIFTNITGNTESYETNGLAVQSQIEDVISNAEAQEKTPEVLLLITYSQGVKAQTSDTMTGRMLKDLGCINIADENPSLLENFGVEAIVDIDPEYIMVIPMGFSNEASAESLGTYLENNPAWSGLSAVKNNHYAVLEPEYFLYKPNAQWGESYEKLANILYGAEQ